MLEQLQPLALKHGSLLVMTGYTQRDCLHSVTKHARKAEGEAQHPSVSPSDVLSVEEGSGELTVDSAMFHILPARINH
ncbi:hypothetical protein FNV43_RR03728 [Rhamnella rubrinervis]|uniref:Uncharacterized protein n=1 Tax=Rhamnella rubrinervis TaxID=2594499 RepID=A0A8K0HJN3_9ROSA|nr:hypothetical protein FNV43_RR03728 [Rhamnella rubrinervis]